MTEKPNEKRFDQLRDEAWEKGAVTGNGVDVAGGPIPRRPGYYGQPVVKPPVWTWEIPLYFFIGGLAGMSALIAAAAAVFHQLPLVRSAMWLAALGAVIGPLLLTLDLGRPRLFSNMLRVFKPQSAMSVGAWVLVFFGACAIPGLTAVELYRLHPFGHGADAVLRIVAAMLIAGSAVIGTVLATYTGVLLGATAIPAWFLHRRVLPIHFGIAGLGSASAALELLGHRSPALNALGFFAAGVRLLLTIWLTIDRHGVADRACHHGISAWLIRLGGILTGPFSLISRILGLTPLAGIFFLVGALVSRFGWLAAGKVSGRDPEAVFAAQG